ncbi:hypothetical protein [Aquimarina sp. 2201CG14-23]|nr:hypothetical protein [Aquimarina sp. 2201CG14-23]MDH7447581.1 hypothetical protein [Aquimarina sp. 2201CG14-23]
MTQSNKKRGFRLIKIENIDFNGQQEYSIEEIKSIDNNADAH